MCLFFEASKDVKYLVTADIPATSELYDPKIEIIIEEGTEVHCLNDQTKEFQVCGENKIFFLPEEYVGCLNMIE